MLRTFTLSRAFLQDFVCPGHNSESAAQSYPQNLDWSLKVAFLVIIKPKWYLYNKMLDLSSFLVMVMLTLGVFLFRKLSVDLRHFQVFIFLLQSTFKIPESIENFILTVLWSDIFPKHKLLNSLVVWLSVWSLLWNCPSFLWFSAFQAIPGNWPADI